MRCLTSTLAATGLALGMAAMSSGCIGEFALSRDVYRRNRSIDAKPVRELTFVALCIVPVYEATLLADLLVFNAVELFTGGDNPLSQQSVDTGTPGGALSLSLADVAGVTSAGAP